MRPITTQEFDSLYVQGDHLHTGGGKGKWYEDYLPPPNRGSFWAWGFGRLGEALVYMYRATNNTKYLDWLVPQIDYIIARRDIDLDIETYSGTGLKLPVWNNDGASYNFNYAFPVHTAMICIPILRFIQVVLQDKLIQFYDKANQYQTICRDALAALGGDEFWYDVSVDKGSYGGAPYGVGIVPQAGQIAPVNQVHAFIFAAGLYDRISETSIYTDRIKKCLRLFKEDFIHVDSEYNSYYWAYHPTENPTAWEDPSHAQETMKAVQLAEFGFDVFDDADLNRFKNTINKLVDNSEYPPLVRRFIHPRNPGTEYFSYDSIDKKYQYEAVARYATLISLGTSVLRASLPVTRFMVDEWGSLDGDEQNSRRLYAIAATIYAQSKVWNKNGSNWVNGGSGFHRPTGFVNVSGEWKRIAGDFTR